MNAVRQHDVVILGGGAAGLMCAIEAGKRGRRVLVIERSEKVGKKILISGGGRCNFTMRGPDGQEDPNEGVYLEVVPGRRLTFTDAFSEGFVPKAGAPFMVATIELEPLAGGKTKYTATARHWTKETAEQHKQVGFFEGWGACADQLNALVSNK